MQDISRKGKPQPKNCVGLEIERKIVEFAIEQPAYGQQRVSNELRKKDTFI